MHKERVFGPYLQSELENRSQGKSNSVKRFESSLLKKSVAKQKQPKCQIEKTRKRTYQPLAKNIPNDS